MAIPPIPPYPVPEATAPPAVTWTPDPGRAALLVHDMQNYFIDPYDRSAEPMATVLPHIRALVDAADAAGAPVYYSAQPPAQAPARRGLLAEFWGAGLQTERDAAIIAELAPGPGHEVVVKWRYSALTRTDLLPALRFAGRDQLLITGVYGHMGCQMTAADAFMNDIRPFLVRDAIADFSAAEHRTTVDWVARRCGRVLDAAEALAALGAAR